MARIMVTRLPADRWSTARSQWDRNASRTPSGAAAVACRRGRRGARCLLIAGVSFLVCQRVYDPTLRSMLVCIALFAIVGAGFAGGTTIAAG